MLSVYTFVFFVFKSRWAGMETGGELAYALNMFIGLIVFNLFESMCSAAGIIRSNPNFQKVIFPLEVLEWYRYWCCRSNSLLLASFCCCTTWLGVYTLDSHILPIVIFPMVVACLALSWLMSESVYFFKDIDQILPVVSSAVFGILYFILLRSFHLILEVF